MAELEEAIAKEDANKMADVSGFRLDAHGNTVSKRVRFIKSEMFLTELMEKICKYNILRRCSTDKIENVPSK